jgi:hypothetical protein
MTRALFLVTLRRCVVLAVLAPLLGLLAVLAVERTGERLGAWIAAGQGGLSRELQDSVDVVLLGVLGVLAFILGTAVFPRDLRERNLTFLLGLPLPRRRTALAIVAAHLLGFVLALGVLLAAVELVRPSLAQRLAPGVLCAYGLGFAAGCALSLLFRSTLWMFVAGVPGIAGFLLVLAWIGSYGGGAVSLLVEARPWLLPALLAGLTSVLLLFACRIFTRGELLLPQRKRRNAGALLVIGALLVGAAAAGQALSIRADRWRIDSEGPAVRGNLLAVSECLKHHWQVCRVRILDWRAGEPAGEICLRGLTAQDGMVWGEAAGAPALFLRSMAVPLLQQASFSGTELAWFAPGGAELGRAALGDGTRWQFEALPGSRMLVVTRRSRDLDAVAILETDTGILRHLFEGPADWVAGLRRGPEALVAVSQPGPAPLRAWRSSGRADELRLDPGPGNGLYIVHGQVSSSRTQATLRLEALYGRPPRTAPWAGRTGSYLFPPYVGVIEPGDPLFYLELDPRGTLADLYCYRPEEGAWSLAGSGLPYDAAHVPRLAASGATRLQPAEAGLVELAEGGRWSTEMFAMAGVALYFELRGPSRAAVLYDAASGRAHDLATGLPAQGSSLSLEMPDGKGEIIARFPCNSGQECRAFAVHRPGSALPPRLVLDPAVRRVLATSDGRLLVRTLAGIERIDADGSRRLLVPELEPYAGRPEGRAIRAAARSASGTPMGREP